MNIFKHIIITFNNMIFGIPLTATKAEAFIKIFTKLQIIMNILFFILLLKTGFSVCYFIFNNLFYLIDHFNGIFRLDQFDILIPWLKDKINVPKIILVSSSGFIICLFILKILQKIPEFVSNFLIKRIEQNKDSSPFLSKPFYSIKNPAKDILKKIDELNP